jgi:hypothetical protein
MSHDAYLDGLREIPALRHASQRRLAAIARIVDTVELPAGAVLHADDRELLVAMVPTKAVVVDRRALGRVRALAPGLAPRAPDDTRVRLVRRSSDGRCPR